MTREYPARRTGGQNYSVNKVVLYKNDVSYFEHKGQVRGNQGFGIDFTTAQPNDVLKSLTLVDLNGNGGNINLSPWRLSAATRRFDC